jgi:hypothetical protein
MAKRRNKKEHEKRDLLAKGYVECGGCSELSIPGSFRCSSCGKLFPKGKKAIAAAVAVIIVLASVGIYYLIPEEQAYVTPTTVLSVSPTSSSAPVGSSITVTFNKDMNRQSVEGGFSIEPAVTGTFSWSATVMTFTPLENLVSGTIYTVTIGSSAVDSNGNHIETSIYRWSFVTEGGSSARRVVGTGENDFWISYPISHPSSGSSVQHPQWVLDALENGIVMILDHSEGCQPCIVQTGICESVYAEHSPEMVYFDLLSGSDEPDASQAFEAYDPSGGVHYIPLTIVITKVSAQDGSVAIGWHSWEGVVYEPILSSWIIDAISYYSENT